MKKRIPYAIAFLILFGTEVFIALFVHDRLIRPYIGDMLVVIVLYCFVKIIDIRDHRWLPLWIFLFAVLTEVLQYFHIVELLGLQDNQFLRVLIGSVFDIKDIACYAVGCIVVALFAWFTRTRGKKEEKGYGTAQK